MGTGAEVVVVGARRPGALLALARQRVEDLEAAWSRFRPDSTITEANRSPGRRVPADASTVVLVERARLAREATNGWFDPCRLTDVVAAGYDRPFAAMGGLEPVDAAELAPGPAASPTAGPIGGSLAERVPPPGIPDDGLATGPDWIRVPAAGFDPGGIGKGLAGDLLVAELLDAGATGALVNLGGDLRCAGTPPPEADGAWTIEATLPDGTVYAVLSVASAGIATSTPGRRRWASAEGVQHHLIDPTVGRPGARFASVTVVAAEGWAAEILATAVCVGGSAAAPLIAANHAAAIAVDHTGTIHRFGPTVAYEHPASTADRVAPPGPGAVSSILPSATNPSIEGTEAPS